MTQAFETPDYDYGHDDWSDTYEVLSTLDDDPVAVMQWCETASLSKAEAVLDLLRPHAARLGLRHLTLKKTHEHKVLRIGVDF
jgi:hypothetical protein